MSVSCARSKLSLTHRPFGEGHLRLECVQKRKVNFIGRVFGVGQRLDHHCVEVPFVCEVLDRAHHADPLILPVKENVSDTRHLREGSDSHDPSLGKD